MAPKKIVVLLLLLSILVYVLGDVILLVDQYRYVYGLALGKPLTTFMPFVALVFMVVLIFSAKIIKSWLKVITLLVPLFLFWIFLTPVYCQASLGICLDRILVSWISGVLFLVLNLAIIVYQKFKEFGKQ